MAKINRFAEMLPEITEWRRDLHQNPELLFDCHRTAGVVADKLKEFGVDEIVTGLGRTGVVGVIKGKSTSSGKVIGLRADMDALPIHETTGAEHASKVEGKMHACGHDGHTAMLLGAAKYLAETRNFDGTVVVIFQPAEEGGGGGKEMVDDGMMDTFGIQEVYGMHNMPNMPLGEFAIRKGAALAATDQFTINVVGKGGHAAFPHDNIDTTVVASHIVIALQTIVSRNVGPLDNVVVSVTSFQTESDAYNVIPQNVELRGTCRTLSKEMRALAQEKIIHIATSTAETFGATAQVDYDLGYPITINHDAETDYATEVARSVAGETKVNPNQLPTMGGEDFSYMLEARPGAMIWLGIGEGATLHHPNYDFNDEAIPAGCSYWAQLTEARMPAA